MLAWYEVWLIGIALPSVGSFESLVVEGKKDSRRGYLWLLIGAFATPAISIFLSQAIYMMGIQPAEMILPYLGDYAVVIALRYLLTWLLLLGLGLLLIDLTMLGIVHGLAFLLGGRGLFSSLVFAVSASIIPVMLAGAILSPIPLLSYIAYLLSFYNGFLLLRAIKAVYKVNATKANIIAVFVTLFYVALLIGFAYLFSRQSGFLFV
jgi:hypothetical protein